MKDLENGGPDLLIGIVTKNRGEVVSKAIESALRQKGIAKRIAVVDDGSRDTTSDLSRQFPGIDWFTKPNSEGYMIARNHWMTNAEEKYFVSLDDDSWFLQEDELEVAHAFMERNPKVGALAFDILSPDRPQPRPRSSPEKVSSFIGCGHLIRLSAVREVGGYEDFPGSYGVEEKDICLRLMDASYDIFRLTGVHVWHDKTPVAREMAGQIKSGVCNDLVMAVKRTPLLLLPAAFAIKFYRHLLFGLRKRSLRPVLSGIYMFLRHLHRSLASRRPVKISTLRAFMQLRTK